MPDPIDTLRSALAGRYAIERELGRGGNAVVYLARDIKHDRKVALKVLAPELALSVRTERFLREIQVTARLNHPHILPLIESGEAGGQLFYVLPYIDGESLRDRLNREKHLPLETALQIARDVAEALEYAHAQGVVHRDIKPENLLLHAGHAVVMDFGIARALTVAAGPAVTESGVAVGTPAYMSPEQAGGGEVDTRTDIYSLGCVLYEMLAGHPPFTGTTAQEILGRHALDTVPQLRAVRPNIPVAVQHSIERALAKHPSDRYASAGAFIEGLSADRAENERPGRRPFAARTAIAAAVLLAVILAGRTIWTRAIAAREVDGPSLAVLCLGLGVGSPGTELEFAL